MASSSSSSRLFGAHLKNGVVIDSNDHASQYHVLQEGSMLYDVKLNQVSLTRNNNKYYIIQLLEHDSKRGYKLWTRWGRTGSPGQHAELTFAVGAAGAGASSGPRGVLSQGKEAAVNAFKEKFKEKTKNEWTGDMSKFRQAEGKYLWMDTVANATMPSVRNYDPSTLPEPLQLLMELICDEDLIEQEVSEIGIDTATMPIGLVSEKRIGEGFEVLREIHNELNKVDRNLAKLERLTSEYFTLIPHDVGFKKMESFLINTPARLSTEVVALKRLQEAAASYRLFQRQESDKATISEIDKIHPHDLRYRKINRKLTPLEPTHVMHTLVDHMTRNLHAKRHTGFRLKLERVFALDLKTSCGAGEGAPEEAGFNRQLLWYGGPLKQWANVLTNGLTLPSAAPTTERSTSKAGFAASDSSQWWRDLPFDQVGQQLGGPALYFHDCLSYAARRCCATENDNRGFLLLCEVALGEVLSVTRPNPALNHHVVRNECGKQSVMAVGTDMPCKWVQFTTDKLDEYNGRRSGSSKSTGGVGGGGLTKHIKADPGAAPENEAQPMEVDGEGIPPQAAVAGTTGEAAEEGGKKLASAVVMPVGELKKVQLRETTFFAMNEYAVYSAAQVLPRFLCQFEFEFQS